ncbi:cell wall-binding repeat-containing protein [Paramicrobacterium sp. CJ85]|uniref:cell wall-binding repeat-containing protein n=1 Tax=Paramicrobacterium sp. CJ85 TaxID=3445355 RepID=UPI003F5DB868
MSPRIRSAAMRTLVLFAVGIVTAAVLTATPIATQKAEAATFDAGHIIDDEVFYDSTTMTESQIRSFINSKVPKCRSGYTCLDAYKENTTARSADKYCKAISGGKNEDAARIIYKVSRACDINPQVILVTLQKEQGLLTHEWPSTWRYTIAMGFGCPDGAACNEKYYGFQNQLYLGARQFQIYRLYPSSFNYVAGKTNTIKWNPNSSCGTTKVYIQNQATAGLYNYTPYVPNKAALNAGYGVGDKCSSYGNRNFFLYFNDWFGSTYQGYSSNPQIKALQKKYFSTLGYTTSGLEQYSDGGAGQEFEKGWAYWHSKTGAYYTRTDIGRSYIALRGPVGVLGYPTSNPKSERDGGSSQQFQKGALYYSPKFSIHRLEGEIRNSYVALKGPSGTLGYPLDGQSSLGGDKVMQPFEKGALYSTKSLGTHLMLSAMKTAYDKAGGAKGRLGFPIDSTVKNSDGSMLQRFQNGTLVISKSGVASTTDRIYGSDRYATSVKISQQSGSATGGTVYIATGQNYPDALSAAALAGAKDSPLLLVKGNSVPSTVATELKRLKPSKIVIVGGTGVVTSGVQKQLSSYGSVTRIQGDDRYETSRNAAASFPAGKTSTAFIATGRNFPDALSAGAAAGSVGAPVILVDGMREPLTAATKSTLTKLGVKNVVIAGGTGVVSTKIESQLKSAGFSVKRLAGADRYATAAAINSAYFSSSSSAYVATGATYADALTGGVAAARSGSALYITTQKCMPTSIRNTALKQAPSTVHVIGGPLVVSDKSARFGSC